MTSDKDHKRQVHTYVCKSATTNGGCGKVAVSGPPVDALVSKLVVTYLSDRDLDVEVEPWTGEAELDEVTGRIAQLMAAFTSGELSKEVVFPSVQKLEDRASQLHEERSDFLRERSVVANRPTNLNEVWPELEVDQRRAIIESVLGCVVVNPAAVKGGRFSPDRVEVVWK
jgi:hypothetical protein